MKKAAKLYVITVSFFLVLIVAVNIISVRTIRMKSDNEVTVMNRIVCNIQKDIDENAVDVPDEAEMNDLLRRFFYDNTDAFAGEYGSNDLPYSAYYLSAAAGESEVSLVNKAGMNEKLWALRYEGGIIGFIVFESADNMIHDRLLFLNLSLLAAFFFTLLICINISRTVLGPFGKLSTYPEKLSKNQISEKLPETKNRVFGRFIWGVNMLSDRLKNDKAKIERMDKDRQTMLTTVAHGIKTPVANIKLYSDAIQTGLYQPDGKVNEEDAKIAEKISKNADDITELVKNLIETASKELISYEVKVESFYLSELKDFLDEEYSNRLEVLKIPYEFELTNNLIINNDKAGICRMLSQLMENAIKYGDGRGIHVLLDKDAEGYYFSVRNKGKLIGESELPYLFKSFWRGSNAENVEGSGIGLFEAREIAKRLGGDIYVKADKENEEMEFMIYLSF
jgi:signal transduction histidine kinase